MGLVAKAVGKMPFAGRAIVENAYHFARSEQYSFKDKASKAAVSAGFLAVFAFMHGVQAKMGISDLGHDWAEFSANPDIASGAEVAVSGLYTVANVAVTYTQAQLGLKTVADTAAYKFVEVNGGEHAQRHAYRAESPTFHEVAFTLGAQTVFLALNDAR